MSFLMCSVSELSIFESINSNKSCSCLIFEFCLKMFYGLLDSHLVLFASEIVSHCYIVCLSTVLLILLACQSPEKHFELH